MKPTRGSRRTRPLTMQLSLLLPAPCITALAPEERADVVVALAHLLLEAARPVPRGDDEAS
jgi:hypothetical protein